MRTAITSAAVLFVATVAFGQGSSSLPYTITVSGRILGELDGDPIKGAMVIVRCNNLSEEILMPNGRGKYTKDLRRGQRYEFTYSAPGMVAKRVVIDTHGAPPLLDVPSITMTVDITLFPPVEGVDTKLFLEPMGKASYKHSVRNIVWDKAYGEEMRAKTRRYMAGYDKKVNGDFVTDQH